MNEAALKEILTDVREGTISPESALKTLRDLPFQDLGYAKIDHHRSIRRGFPEAVFCQGKTIEQIKGIITSMLTRDENILATRASKDVFEAIRSITSRIEYHEAARIIIINPRQCPGTENRILVVSAGTADMPVAEEAAVTAEAMGNTVKRLYDVGVAGIHRLFAHRQELSEAAVLIVVAGMEGALPSVVAGITDVPIIAVPTSIGYGANFHGLSALLTMLNSCANGISVVNIDNGFGAAYSASLINQLAERSRNNG